MPARWSVSYRKASCRIGNFPQVEWFSHPRQSKGSQDPSNSRMMRRSRLSL